MTSKILLMLLGACCASAWWAFATIIPPDTAFPALCVLLTVGVAVVLLVESINVNS